MTPRLVLCAGGFMARGVAEQLATVPALEAAVVLLPRLRDFGPDLLARCTLLIEEIAPPEEAGSADEDARTGLPAGCVTIRLPPCRFDSLWPLMTDDPRNRECDGIPYEMGDRLAVAILQNEVSADGRLARYGDADLPSLMDLPALHGSVVDAMLARDAMCDIHVAPFVLSRFRSMRLFHTRSRPTAELVYHALAQLYAFDAVRGLCGLPYQDLLDQARRWADDSGFGADRQAPIHPAVVAFHGLNWCPPDRVYAFGGEWRTFAEWIAWYFAYVAAPPKPAEPERERRVPMRLRPPSPVPPVVEIGSYLWAAEVCGRQEQMDLLAPASRVRRSPIIFAMPGALAGAPFGHMMRDADCVEYELGPTYAINLREGVVLGADGLVLFENRAVADTCRSLPSGEQAALIETILPHALVLKPGLPEQTTTVEGQYFCGVGTVWPDLAHWIIATLPRLFAYTRLRRRYPELRIVIPALPPNSVYSETLELLHITRYDHTAVGPREAVLCEELMVTSAFDLWSISPLCRDAATYLGRSLPPPRPEASSFNRIYLRLRAMASRIANPAAIDAVLDRYGVASVFIEDLALRQRIAIMRQARLVIGEHGGALAHILFAEPGARVLEIFGPHDAQPMYWSLASVAGLDYGYVVGNAGPDGVAFTLPPETLRGAIETMIASTD